MERMNTQYPRYSRWASLLTSTILEYRRDRSKFWPTNGVTIQQYLAANPGLSIDWAATNYIDWGAFISAIINFLLVALILFLIIKTFNRVHQAGEEAKKRLEKKEEAEEPAKEE